jgi:hypothetical protein
MPAGIATVDMHSTGAFGFGTDARVLNGDEEQVASIGCAGGLNVVERWVGVRFHGCEANVGLGRGGADVRDLDSGVATEDATAKVHAGFLPGVLANTNLAKTEEEFTERHGTQNRIPYT